MLIKSQNGSYIISLENGMLSENGYAVMFQTIIDGPTWELGKYPGKSVSDRTRTRKVMQSIFQAKLSGVEAFQMPQDAEVKADN